MHFALQVLTQRNPKHTEWNGSLAFPYPISGMNIRHIHDTKRYSLSTGFAEVIASLSF